MLVKLNTFTAAAHTFCRGLSLEHTHLAFHLSFQRVAVFFCHTGNNVQRLNGFVDMDRGCRHLKTRTLDLTRPLQSRVKVRVVLVGLDLFLTAVMLCHTNRRVIGALFVIVGIRFYIPHFGCIFHNDLCLSGHFLHLIVICS